MTSAEQREFERDMETFVDMYEAAQGIKESAQHIPQHGQHETAHEPCVRCVCGPIRCKWFRSGCFREGAQHRA